jgi:hypothetical protein
VPPTCWASLQGLFLAPPLMEVPEEIVKEPFLRTLVALEGKQGSNFFDTRLHGS